MMTPTVEAVEAMMNACNSAFDSDDTKFAAKTFMDKIQEANNEREAIHALMEFVHEVIAKTATEIAVSLFNVEQFHECCEQFESKKFDDELKNLLDNQ